MKEYFIKNVDGSLILYMINAKVGDTVKFKDISVEIDMKIDEKNWDWLYQHASHSRIGEVSIGATWVKEGMMFSEDEIVVRPGGSSVRRPIKTWHPAHMTNVDIFVKCPTCGCFK